ncbi:hypothetical protein GMST_20260 [Geomonas silvestris]|uniref:Uncharacterized protein n=1 Tax=Geomonas silvestris TaxID=2740184 RepID=A0A6V8MI63_9BACT|nr:hypothetical protein GMST_20260 [Geomonas silvestris]
MGLLGAPPQRRHLFRHTLREGGAGGGGRGKVERDKGRDRLCGEADRHDR